MIRKIAILAMIIAWGVQSQAIDVRNTAGHLAEVITDHSVTTLTINGSMNAEDFYFIGSSLNQLAVLNLEQVTIEPCTTPVLYYWNREFPANEVPIGALADMNLVNVTLPAGTAAIQEAAFAGCDQLTTVNMPSGLMSIGNYAFAGCSSLAAISLPASVTAVGDGAFMRCSSLESLTVEPAGNLSTIGEAALMDCPLLTTVNLGNQMNGLGERLLAGSGLTTLDLTASTRLTSLADWMMVQTPVTTVILPESLKSLGQGAFLATAGLNDVTMGAQVEQLDDYVFAGSGLAGDIAFESLTTMGDYALYNNTGLSQVSLPASMAWLGNYAMAGMTGMEAITCEAADVPSLGENVWAGVNQASVLLTVPKSSMEDYRNAAQWKEFFFGTHWVRGDVNNDGEVNIADVNALIDIILGGQPDSDTMRRADVNQDGEVGIADVNAVIDIILDPGSSAPAIVNTSDRLRLDDLAISPGEQRTLTLKLDNAGHYSAMQCDLTLPQGLTLVDGSIAAGASARGHVTDSRDVTDDAVRTVVYSMSKRQFDSEGNSIVTFTVQADGSLPADAQIAVTNIVLSDDNNVAWHAPDYAARVANGTGVEDLMAGSARVWVDGRTLCVDAAADGRAQVVAVNGTVRDLVLTAGINRCAVEPGIYVVVLEGKTCKVVVK